MEQRQKEQQSLDKELEEAKKYEALKEARDRFQRAEKKHQAVQEAKAALADLKEVTATDLDALQNLNLRLTDCRPRWLQGDSSCIFLPGWP